MTDDVRRMAAEPEADPEDIYRYCLWNYTIRFCSGATTDELLRLAKEVR